MKESLLNIDVLWKVLVFILCLCVFVQGLRIKWLEDRVDKIQECFLEMSKNNTENTVKFTQELTEFFKGLVSTKVITIADEKDEAEGSD